MLNQALMVDVPVMREAPPELLSALQAIDPNIIVAGMCRDRWLVAYLSDDPADRARGRRLLANTKRALAAIEAKNPGRDFRTVPRMRDRLIASSVKALGVKGARVYQSQYPHTALVAQVRDNDFYQRHTTEEEFWKQYQQVEEEAKAAVEAELTDDARARDAWRYAFTLNHSPGIRTIASLPAHRSSVRTVHKTI